MSDSILNSIKKVLGMTDDYTAFDLDVVMHINSVFSTLHQLGVGPDNGFMIEDATATWDTFLGDDPLLNQVKSYMYLRVRLLFDPPATSYLIQASERQASEMEWRMNVYVENKKASVPGLTYPVVVLDGGSA